MSKEFGLIIPGQRKKEPEKRPRPPTKPSIFDESSDSSASDNEAPQKRPTGKAGVVSGPSLMERRVARNLQEKALAEDPTIFQYDEHYDEMDTKREEAKETKRLEPRKAKYIGRLMEHAERRKLENELRIERQVQKDREAEGEMYKDKDTFVTLAYRRKLESMRELQEREEHENYREGICDVTKQKNLDGFYRHLYEQKLGNSETAAFNSEAGYKPITSEAPSSQSKQRSYRKRRSSADDEKPDAASAPKPTDESKPGSSCPKAHLANNIDADSDFSIDDSSDEAEPDEKVQPADQTDEAKKSPKSKTSTDEATDKPDPQTASTKQKPTENVDGDADVKSDLTKLETDVPTKVVKPTVDRAAIWLKRTVGDVFDAALARYQKRKQARSA